MRGRGGGGAQSPSCFPACLISTRGGLGEFSKVMQTIDCISGLRITFENSPNPASVQIRLYKYGKKFSIAFKMFLKINSTNEWKLCLLTS